MVGARAVPARSKPRNGKAFKILFRPAPSPVHLEVVGDFSEFCGGRVEWKERSADGQSGTELGASVPEELEFVVFCEHAQLEQIRQTGSFPKLATASHASLQLFTEGFDGTTAQGSTFVFPLFIVDVFPMRSEVFHFSGDRLSDFGGTFSLGLGFE